MKISRLTLTAVVAATGLFFTSCGSSDKALMTQAESILPVPVSLEGRSGSFTLTDGATVGAADTSLMPAARYLASLLAPATGYDIKAVEGEGTITLRIGDTAEAAEDAYTLRSSSSGVEITGSCYDGVIAGIQSLRQMLPAAIESKTKVDGTEWTIPAVDITDHATFGWRGIELDVSRHFYTTTEVKELLDLMALYKLNKFHWHLTDDQGWRVEIKRYPHLTEKGAWRKFNNQDLGCLSTAAKTGNTDFELPADRIRITEEGDTLYGGFYTQDEIRDIVAYARVRGIDVVPEIDMPGHMLAAVSNYKGVSCFDQTG